MAYKVFISSAAKDIEVAHDVARRLKEAGVSVLPIVTGEVIVTASVTRSLHQADEVIVILTGNSVNSSRVMYEMGAASALHKRVTPIVVNVQDSEIPPFAKTHVRFAELPSYIGDLAKRASEAKAQPA